MEKRVQRKEVDLFVGGPGGSSSALDRPGSSSKLANQGKNLIFGSSSSVSAGQPQASGYQLPDPSQLAAKYGIENEFVKSPTRYSQDDMTTYGSPSPGKPGYGNDGNTQGTNADMESLLFVMKSKLVEKNKKIEHLCQLLEVLEPIPGFNPAKYAEILQRQQETGVVNDEMVDLRDSKIVSLAKKSHRLNQQLNKEKLNNERLADDMNEWKKRYDQLQNEIEVLKSTLRAKSETKVIYNRQNIMAAGGSTKSSGLPNISENDDLDGSTDNGEGGTGQSNEGNEKVSNSIARKYKESQKTIEELKKKMKEIADENATLTKTLKKELGDNVTLEQAVDSGWRGRAQQIVMLKSKVIAVSLSHCPSSLLPIE
jgi:hypothetical protein